MIKAKTKQIEPKDRFNRLLVLSRIPGTRGHYNAKVVCLCDCGTLCTVRTSSLRNGHTRSCGCLNRELRRVRRTTHGESGSLTYNSWALMKNRCENPNADNYKWYGGRGITVCERWKTSFEAFLEDMGHKPSRDHQIERVNNDGPYSPENCIWATSKTQHQNQRSNIYLTAYGKTMSLLEWAVELNVNPSILRQRRKQGWAHERIISQPIKRRKIEDANS